MVRMYHDNPKATGGPTTADVPQEAVIWMQQAGWYIKPGEHEFLASQRTSTEKSASARVKAEK